MTTLDQPRKSGHMSPDVRVVVDFGDDTVTAHVRGRLDYVTVGTVRERLLELAHSGVRGLVVDLADCDLLDATGPAALLHVHDVCRVRGMAFSAHVTPGSAAERCLRGCGLLTLLTRPPVASRGAVVESSTGVVPG
jgi:anti-anti-sigma factor